MKTKQSAATSIPTSASASPEPKTIKALVLFDCIYGESREVVTLPADEVERGRKAGMLDPHPAAVESALALAADGK